MGRIKIKKYVAVATPQTRKNDVTNKCYSLMKGNSTFKLKSFSKAGRSPERINHTLQRAPLIYPLDYGGLVMNSKTLHPLFRDSVFNAWMEGEDLQAWTDPEKEPELYKVLDKANWKLFDTWMQFKEVRG